MHTLRAVRTHSGPRKATRTWAGSMAPTSRRPKPMRRYIALNVSVQIREVWNAYELDLINYQNKCRLIRGWDDLFNKVKEHINSVSAMKLSPYYKVSAAAFILYVYKGRFHAVHDQLNIF